MESQPSSWFSDDILSAVIGHMNGEHLHDSLTIVRGVGQTPDAVAGSLASLDPDGARFNVELANQTSIVVFVPWTNQPRERADIRHEIVDWTERSTVA